ncbi:MAG: hygromycin-B 7''-O-kinase [Myxococcota bacterium]|jgi:hygromycin-B 7''-O-kinase
MIELPEDVVPGTALRTLLEPAQWKMLFSMVFGRHRLAREGLAPEAGGSDVVWGTAEAVIKLTAPRWAAEIGAEARAAQWLAGKLPFETPRLLGQGEIQGWPYVITARIGGVSVARVWSGLRRDERLRLAARLGEATAALHAVPPPEGPDGWEDFLAARRADLQHRHRKAPEGLQEQLGAFMKAAPPEPAGGRAWLHTELLDEHIHVTEAAGGWAVCGMLDFADGRVGAPGYDLTAPAEFIFKGEPGLYRAFVSAYGLPDAEPEGLMRWYLLHLFSNLSRMLGRLGTAERFEGLAVRAFG